VLVTDLCATKGLVKAFQAGTDLGLCRDTAPMAGCAPTGAVLIVCAGLERRSIPLAHLANASGILRQTVYKGLCLSLYAVLDADVLPRFARLLFWRTCA